MRLQILGPIALSDGHQDIRIGGPREHVVLGMLALRANHAISVDRLIDAVWERPPATAQAQIQTSVSQLRKALGHAGLPGAIITTAQGYMLDIAEQDLDSLVFTHELVHATAIADPAEASEILAAALEHWRGPTLQGIRSSALEAAALGLDERRLVAQEELARHELALGRTERVIPELRELTSENPLRETGYELLALALYRCGRQVEALEVLRQARETLVEQVGVEPGPELRRLEQRILRHDGQLQRSPSAPAGDPAAAPALPVPAAMEPSRARAAMVPRELPHALTDFVGRQEELRVLREALISKGAGEFGMPVVGICGAGGIGKTTLAVRLGHEVADEFPDGQLFAGLEGVPQDDPLDQVLSRLLRSLGVRGDEIPFDHHDRVQLYRTTLAGKRVLVVLDGAPVDGDVSALLPGDQACAVLVTARARLHNLQGSHWVTLDGFGQETSIALLERMVGQSRIEAERDAATQVAERAGGLPLALRIAGARLASRPQWRVAELSRRLRHEADRLDEFSFRGVEVRSSIATSYRGLSAEAKHLFQALALLPREQAIPVWAAAALVDKRTATTERLLDELVDLQLLQAHPVTGEPMYRLHGLVRAFAGERVQEWDARTARAARNRWTLAALELLRRAHRREYGGPYTTIVGPTVGYVPKGFDEEPMDNDPMAWLDQHRLMLVAAVQETAELESDDACWELALGLITLFEPFAYHDDWRDCARLALDLCRRTANLLGQAAGWSALATLEQRRGDYEQAGQAWQTSLELFVSAGHHAGRVMAAAEGAQNRVFSEGSTAAYLAWDTAIEDLRTICDPLELARHLSSRAAHHIRNGNVEQAESMLAEAERLARGSGFSRGIALVQMRRTELHIAAGNYDAALECSAEALRITRRTGDVSGQGYVLYWTGMAQLGRGDAGPANDTLQEAGQAALLARTPVLEGRVELALARVAQSLHRPADRADHLARAKDLFAHAGAAPLLQEAEELIQWLASE